MVLHYCFTGVNPDKKFAKFTDLVHEVPAELRSAEHRLRCAALVRDHYEEKKELIEIAGVQGFPLLHGLPFFDASFSFCPDLLHVALLGIGKTLIETLLKASGNLENLRRRGQRTFKRESE